MKSTHTARLPKLVNARFGNAFTIRWYATAKDANTISALVKASGATYYEGKHRGQPCGRDTAYDYTDPVLGKMYAVTD